MQVTVQCHKESQFPLLPEVTIKNEGNVFVRDVPEGGVFAGAGVKDGDVIVSVNGHPFENISSPNMFSLLSGITGDVTIVIRSPGETGKKEINRRTSQRINKKVNANNVGDKSESREVRGESCPNCDKKFPSISAVSSHFTEVHSKHPPGPRIPGEKTPGQRTPGQKTPGEKTPGQKHQSKQQTESNERILRENHVLKKKNEKMAKEIESFRTQQEAFRAQLEKVTEKSKKHDLQTEIRGTEQKAKIKDLERDLQIKQKTIEQLIKDNEFLVKESSQTKNDSQEKEAMDTLRKNHKEELDNLKFHFQSQIEEISKDMGVFTDLNEDIQTKIAAYDELQKKYLQLEKDLKSKDEKNRKYKDNFSKVTKELKDLQEKLDNQEKNSKASNDTEEENDDLRVKLTNEIESCKELQEKLENEMKNSTDIKIKNKKLNEKYNNVKDGLKDALEEGKKMKLFIKSFESDLGKATDRENKLKAEYEESLHRNKSQEENQSQLKRTIFNLELEVKSLKENLQKIESSERDNLNTLSHLTEKESLSRQQNQKNKKIIDVLTKEVEELRNKIEDASNDKSVSNSVEAEMLKLLGQENESLKEQIESFTKSVSGLRDQCEEKLEIKEKKLVELQQKVSDVELQNTKLELKMTRFDEFIEEYTYLMRKMRKKEQSEKLKERSSYRIDESDLKDEGSRKRSYYKSSDPRRDPRHYHDSKRFRTQETKRESENNLRTDEIKDDDESSTSMAKPEEYFDMRPAGK